MQRKYRLGLEDVEQGRKVMLADPAADLKDIFLDTIYVTNRNRPVTPKGFNQKAYIDAIRKHDIVFGIGPAATGKPDQPSPRPEPPLAGAKGHAPCPSRPPGETADSTGSPPPHPPR